MLYPKSAGIKLSNSVSQITNCFLYVPDKKVLQIFYEPYITHMFPKYKYS